MLLGTFDRNPPPLFRQGASALTRLAFFAALALALMVADARYRMVDPLRSGIATVLWPVQRALQWPGELWVRVSDYVGGLDSALVDAQRARQAALQQAEAVTRAQRLAQENERLRALLALGPALAVRSRAAEVLYEAADPFSRRVVIDRGAQAGVLAGSPVINEQGVLGQVVRVHPMTAEVALLVDRDTAIPVLNARTQWRSAAFGGAGGPGMELRFMATNADVREGDLLTTSGLDGVYPAGLAVARVASVERRVESGFARIALAPAANPDGVRHVLLLEPLAQQLPPRPVAQPETPPRVKPPRGPGPRAAAPAPSPGASR